MIDEELIKYGWEEDVWFHVDNLSSAHIYVRLPEGQDWEKIDQGLLIDCAQLTKANSIEGKILFIDHSLIDLQVPTILCPCSHNCQATKKTTSPLYIHRGRI